MLLLCLVLDTLRKFPLTPVITAFISFLGIGSNQNFRIEERRMNEEEKETWWNRNWKWFVPVGGLGCIVIIIAISTLGLYIISRVMKSSEVYKESLVKIRESVAVIEGSNNQINLLNNR